MIIKVLKIKFVKYLQIGHIIETCIKSYLNSNTNYKDLKYTTNTCIYEFRFIDGRRYIYRKPYTRTWSKDEISGEIVDMIKPVKEFLDVIIMSIEMI